MVERYRPTNEPERKQREQQQIDASRDDPLATIRKRALARALNISTSTLMRWVRLNKFPKPIAMSEQIVAWRRSSVEAWLREQEERSDGQE